jgi:MFS family permease
MSEWWSDTFVSLREPRYRVLWWGTLANFAALWIAIVARGFLTFDITDSTVALGLTFFGFGIPMLLLTPVSGIVADRVPRKPLMVVAQWALALTNGVIAVLILADAIEFWMIFVASIAEGAAVAIGIPARQALIGDFVEEDELGNAMALQQVAFNAARVAMPSLAGVLIAIDLVGMGWTFVLLTVLYALAALVFQTVPSVPRRVLSGSSFVADLVEGVHYLRSRPSILTLVLVAYVVELTVFPYFAFLPAYVEDVLGATEDQGTSVELGVLTTVIAIGAFATSLWVANIADRAHAWTVHAVSVVMFTVLLLLLALGPPAVEEAVVGAWPGLEDSTLLGVALTPAYVAALAIGLLLGAAEIGFFGLNQSLSMKYAHEDYYGRVQAVLLLGFALNGWAGFPIGVLASWIGTRETFAILGLAGAALAVAVLLWGARRGARADAFAPEAPAELDPVAARERAMIAGSG